MTVEDNLRFSKHKEIRGKPGYHRYDNYDAIEVPFTDAIPGDYDGVMGVPITFLDKYNPEQFEVLGSSLQLAEPMSKFAERGTYGADGTQRFYVPQRDATHRRLYERIVIRRIEGAPA